MLIMGIYLFDGRMDVDAIWILGITIGIIWLFFIACILVRTILTMREQKLAREEEIANLREQNRILQEHITALTAHLSNIENGKSSGK